ncbi:HopJ type III effector protein [Noviherbaspirillum aridicola]|uniref:Type III effector n=1 Tax=Noviherbaspirillum aridicola TaxID=2849687 RepID=A0ABQ4Q3F2_9BURK|nr:HopJ type III effector protein [Noviherbaspirillum aridicola]GIZ51380.1 type III effector [Noviherbaspirillum aridicola]
MTIQDFLQRLRTAPDTISFNDCIAVIDAHYAFTPTAFTNGSARNEAGQNNGSCKLLSFARMQGLSEAETLACFGDYYRKDVLGHPDGSDHQNIRNFMQGGWQGVRFEGEALQPK